MTPDIIFIGAGPIGLLAAIQTKLGNPEKNVLMFEKYAEPTRTHAMYVDKSVFHKMNRANGFGEILDNISPKVIISDLEKTLRQYALKIGIEIKFEEIKSFNELTQQYPDTKYFIGSGGLRGIVRSQIFNNETQIEDPLRYAAEVKYKVKGKTTALNKLTQLPGVLTYTNHLVSEYVGHEKEGLTPVALRIFIDKNTYDAMRGATFKNPYKLADKDKVDAKLMETIEVHLKARETILNEKIDPETLKIVVIEMSIYASKYFYRKLDNNKVVIQIGEETFACPFYRSFNDNASYIPQFAETMKALFENKNIERHFIPYSTSLFSSSASSRSEVEPLEYFGNELQRLINSEYMTVHILNKGIDMVETSAATSRTVPQIPVAKLSFYPGGRQFNRAMAGHNEEQHHEEKPSQQPKKFECVII